MNDIWYKDYWCTNNQNRISYIFNSIVMLGIRLKSIFAILTAIVTIEPTAKASLKKAIEDYQQQL